MKNKKLTLFILLIFTVLLTSSVPVSTKAEWQIPDTIKVGLYFTDPSVHISTALPQFTINAAAGLQIGYIKDSSFTEIYDEPTPALLTIRKDTYFSNMSGALQEYDPTSSSVPTGVKYGPYHIKLGPDLQDQPSAAALAAAYAQQGIAAYPVFSDTWQVWTGFYTDAGAAGQDMTASSSLSALAAAGTVLTLVQPQPNRIVVSDSANKPLCIFGSDTAYFRIAPRPENNPDILNINNKPYRGQLEVRRLTGSDMTVINVVNIEEYLYGNVPPEIGGKSPAEALKAQAVTSKMYALGNLGKHKKQGFDITATTSDQVYKGYSSEVASCNAAIDTVKDVVLTYNGQLAEDVFYFASSGGRTEDSVNVWGVPVPYLKSVDDKYDPVDTWTKTLRASDIKSRVPGIGNIMGMDVTRRSDAGRVTQLAVRGDSNTGSSVFSLDRCRTIFSLDSQLYNISTDADTNVSADGTSTSVTQLGGKSAITAGGVVKLGSANNKVYAVGANGSTNVIALVPETYTFSGKGWGHAVGLSQEGAIGMGKAGIKYDEILAHYFPGTNVG